MMNMTGACMICRDPHRLDTYVWDVQNMIRVIDNLIKEDNDFWNIVSDEKYNDLYMNLKMDQAHIHFMCGSCHKANMQSLRNEEEKLNQSLIKLIYELETEDSRLQQALQKSTKSPPL